MNFSLPHVKWALVENHEKVQVASQKLYYLFWGAQPYYLAMVVHLS
jgi:hypothetical protein